MCSTDADLATDEITVEKKNFFVFFSECRDFRRKHVRILKSYKLHHLMYVTVFIGELKTLMPLDREEQAVYYLLVKATDGGGRFCQSNIILTLEDVNDNAPEFTADPYSITVFENTETKTLLTRVQATDADAGIHSLIDTSVMVSKFQ